MFCQFHTALNIRFFYIYTKNPSRIKRCNTFAQIKDESKSMNFHQFIESHQYVKNKTKQILYTHTNYLSLIQRRHERQPRGSVESSFSQTIYFLFQPSRPR